MVLKAMGDENIVNRRDELIIISNFSIFIAKNEPPFSYRGCGTKYFGYELWQSLVSNKKGEPAWR